MIVFTCLVEGNAKNQPSSCPSGAVALEEQEL